MELQNKTLCFLGDSLTASGVYPQEIRAYFKNNGINCRVFNRGLGGNRASMVQYLLEEEIYWLKPDYVFFTFGANDMGVWLYDSQKSVTPELLKERDKRNQVYYASMEQTITLLKEKGITPIVMSPFAMDELLTECEDIETVKDNKEKADYIGPSFYKRATFRSLNTALKEYSENLKTIAKKRGVQFCDLFTDSYQKHLKVNGMFGPDGVHLTEKGCRVATKSILSFLGFTDFSEEKFAISKAMEEYRELEDLERSVQYLPWALFSPYFGDRTEKDIRKSAETFLQDEKASKHLKKVSKAFIEHRANIKDLQKRLYQANEKLMKD